MMPVGIKLAFAALFVECVALLIVGLYKKNLRLTLLSIFLAIIWFHATYLVWTDHYLYEKFSHME